jgi:riboflavin biosynthesis pyrimidine reductase
MEPLVGQLSSRPMIRTEPGGPVVDPLEVQTTYSRGRPDRPWVIANFISTIDGAAVVQGGSTAINDDDDKAMFAALRVVPDFVLVGAGTVRAENYQPIKLDNAAQSARVEAGMEPNPHLIVVSGSLDLETTHRVFSDPEHRVTVLTGQDSQPGRFAELSDVADVIRLNSTGADDLIHYMRMARLVLCEGGPTLMGAMIAGGYIDEMALTVAPMLVSGVSPRITHGASPEQPMEMRLDRVLYGDRSLFLRYLRADD